MCMCWLHVGRALIRIPVILVQLGPKRIHQVRTRGGNVKYRAMRLDQGNFSWGSEGVSLYDTAVAHSLDGYPTKSSIIVHSCTKLPPNSLSSLYS